MAQLNGKTAVTNILPAPVTEAGAITCGRTVDADVLRKFYMNNNIWDAMQDDGSPKASELDFDAFMPDHVGNALIFVDVSYNDNLAALFMFHQTNAHTYDIHSALLPEFWGQSLAHLLGLEACRWMVENTPCEKITTSVPSFNNPAYNMALAAGMSVEGCNRMSFMKHGQLYDQTLLGFTKGEIQCL